MLGAFAKLGKSTVTFVMIVRLSFQPNSVPIGRIFTKFDIVIVLRKSVKKI